jgi:hypothetical protein
MEMLFWFCWSFELVLITWWFVHDMKLVHTRTNPAVYLCMAYLVVVLQLRMGFDYVSLSEKLVIYPAVPLFILLCVALVYTVTHRKSH